MTDAQTEIAEQRKTDRLRWETIEAFRARRKRLDACIAQCQRDGKPLPRWLVNEYQWMASGLLGSLEGLTRVVELLHQHGCSPEKKEEA
jgi:hypothetical protein